jgi:hypothetical protein
MSGELDDVTRACVELLAKSKSGIGADMDTAFREAVGSLVMAVGSIELRLNALEKTPHDLRRLNNKLSVVLRFGTCSVAELSHLMRTIWRTGSLPNVCVKEAIVIAKRESRGSLPRLISSMVQDGGSARSLEEAEQLEREASQPI